jgi:pimeloyl-ACP methyl ester carboxylesterase
MPQELINGTHLYYEEHGQGIPLVMIQGFAGNHAVWYFQVRAFEKYFRVITFDARGLGKSATSKVPYTVPVMAKDVIGIMDYLKIDKAHILGLSLGGLTAQTIAIDYPERVVKLILGSTLYGTDTQCISESAQVLGKDFLKMDPVKTMNFFISIAFNKRLYRYVSKLFARPQITAEYSGYFKQMQSVGEYSTYDRLPLVQAPSLVITGSGDRLILPHCSEMIAEKIPHAKLVMVQGGSHAMFLEMRGRFNREVLRFLLNDS